MRTVRQLAVSLLLPLLMLLAQHSAVVHEVGHLGGSIGAGQRGKSPAVDTQCLTCVAHADLSGLASADAFSLPVLLLVQRPPQALTAAVLAAETLTPRSRGPPTFL